MCLRFRGVALNRLEITPRLIYLTSHRSREAAFSRTVPDRLLNGNKSSARARHRAARGLEFRTRACYKVNAAQQ